MTVPPVAYYGGDDSFQIDEAVTKLAAALGEPKAPLDVWRAAADDDAAEEGASGSAARRRERLLGEIEARVATAPLFGGGTMVVVRQPEALAREGRARARLIELIGSVPPGNGLCLTELSGSSARGGKESTPLRDAVRAAGGSVTDFTSPSKAGMETWIGRRATALGLRLGPGAARLVAERIGAYVRESDVDRRRQTELCDQELRKLALYRPDGTVSVEDVMQLVAESVPGSAWAFLDAVAARRLSDAGAIAERLLRDGAPLPVLVAQLHRRVRELIVVRDHLDAGMRGPELMRTMRLAPYRAQKLEEQARRWSSAELELALDGLVELDLASKGISLDGSTRQMSDGRSALGLQGWLAEQIPSG